MLRPDGRAAIEYMSEEELETNTSSEQKTRPEVAAGGIGAAVFSFGEFIGYVIYELPAAERQQQAQEQWSQGPQSQPLNTAPASYNSHFVAETGLLAAAGLLGAILCASATFAVRRGIRRYHQYMFQREAQKTLQDLPVSPEPPEST